MAVKVLSVVGRRDGDVANSDAILCLETWLEMAREGKVTSVAIAGIGPGLSQQGHSRSIDGNLIGAVAVLQQVLISHVVGEG